MKKAIILVQSENIDEIRWFSDKVSELSDEYPELELTYMEEDA